MTARYTDSLVQFRQELELEISRTREAISRIRLGFRKPVTKEDSSEALGLLCSWHIRRLEHLRSIRAALEDLILTEDLAQTTIVQLLEAGNGYPSHED